MTCCVWTAGWCEHSQLAESTDNLWTLPKTKDDSSSDVQIVSEGQPPAKRGFISVEEAMEKRKGFVPGRLRKSWDEGMKVMNATLLPCSVCGVSDELQVVVAEDRYWNIQDYS